MDFEPSLGKPHLKPTLKYSTAKIELHDHKNPCIRLFYFLPRWILYLTRLGENYSFQQEFPSHFFFRLSSVPWPTRTKLKKWGYFAFNALQHLSGPIFRILQCSGLTCWESSNFLNGGFNPPLWENSLVFFSFHIVLGNTT